MHCLADERAESADAKGCLKWKSSQLATAILPQDSQGCVTCLQDGFDPALYWLSHFYSPLAAQDECVHHVIAAPPQEDPQGPADKFEAAPNRRIIVQALYNREALPRQQYLQIARGSQAGYCRSQAAKSL